MLLRFRLQSAQDGRAYHLSQEVVLEYQEQQEEGGEDPWWQAGFPGMPWFTLMFYQIPALTLSLAVPEEAPLRAQVPHDWPQAEGCDSRHQPGEGSHVQEAEDSLQVFTV